MHVIDLREPPKELPSLDFDLTQDEKLKADITQLWLEATRNDQHERQRRQQG